MTTTAPAAPTVAATGRARTATRRRSPARRRSTPLTIAMLAALVYFLLPLFWLVVALDQDAGGPVQHVRPVVLRALRAVRQHPDDVHPRRRRLPALAAQHRAVRGRRRGRRHAAGGRSAGTGSPSSGSAGDGAVFAWCSAPIMVPTTALAIPTYLLFARSAWSTRRGR